MSRGVNKVIIIGHVGQDPEVKSMPNGNSVVNISVATSESWTDKKTGQKQERSEWHKLVFFNRLAEIVGEYVRKGSKIYIEGSLRTRKWEKDGQDHYSTEIVVREMQLLDSKQQGQQAQPDQQKYQQGQAPPQGQPQGTYQQGPNALTNQQDPQQQGQGFDGATGDIPFSREGA